MKENFGTALKKRCTSKIWAIALFVLCVCFCHTAHAANPAYRTQNASTLVLTVDYNGIQDVTTIGFNASATYGFDGQYDADKPDGGPGRPTLYTYFTDQNEWYAINTIPLLTQIVGVPMGLRPQNTGTMTLSASGIQTFDATTYIYLEDKTAGGPWFNLRNGTYAFNTTVNDSQTRFIIHFSPPALISTQPVTCTLPGVINMEQPGNAHWDYTIINKDSVTVATGVLDSLNPASVNVIAGVYMIHLTDTTGYTVVKTVQVEGAQPVAAAFSASDTLVQISDDVLFTSSTSNAITYSWNFGDGSGTSGQATSHSYDSAGVYLVTLTVTNSSGCAATDTQTITVMPAVATAINNAAEDKLRVWSYGSTVFVDFGGITNANAEVQFYNILGQKLSDERFARSAIYTKQLANTAEGAYIILKITNNYHVSTRKVFIANSTN